MFYAEAPLEMEQQHSKQNKNHTCIFYQSLLLHWFQLSRVSPYKLFLDLSFLDSHHQLMLSSANTVFWGWCQPAIDASSSWWTQCLVLGFSWVCPGVLLCSSSRLSATFCPHFVPDLQSGLRVPHISSLF